jgi:hypothetical protein
MRKSVVVITILTLLIASCTKQRELNSPALPLTSTSALSAAVQRTTTSVPPTTLATTSAPIPTTAPCGEVGSAIDEAKNFVEALIDGEPMHNLPDLELWVAVVAGGSINQTTSLSEAAGRAAVAVSVAFESSTDKATTDPIGLRIELANVDGCWHVESVGYL